MNTFEEVCFEVAKVENEIECGNWLHLVIIQRYYVAFQVDEHGDCESLFEKCSDIVHGQNHLLVQFDRNFEGNREDNPQKSRLNLLVVPKIVICEVHCGENGLILALGLDSKLQNGQKGLFSHPMVNPILMHLSYKVTSVILHIVLTLFQTQATFFSKHVSQVVEEL